MSTERIKSCGMLQHCDWYTGINVSEEWRALHLQGQQVQEGYQST